MPQTIFTYNANTYIVDTDSNPPGLWKVGDQGPVQVPETDPAWQDTGLRQKAVDAIYSNQARTAGQVAASGGGVSGQVTLPQLSNPLAGTATTPQLSGGPNQPASAPRTAAQVAASGGGVSGQPSLPQLSNPLAGTATTPQITPPAGSNQPPTAPRTAAQVAGNPGLSWPNIPLPQLSNPLAGTATTPQLTPSAAANQPPSQARTAAQVAASGNGVGTQSTAPAAAPTAPAAGALPTGVRWVPDPSLQVGGYFVDANGQPLPPSIDAQGNPRPTLGKDGKTPSVWDGTQYVPGATTPVTAAPAAADSTAAAPATAASPSAALSAAQQSVLHNIQRDGWTVTGDTDEYGNHTSVDESGISSTVYGPTGNKVWAITGPGGKNEVVTVRASTATPGQYEVVKPPPNLPVPQAPTGNENTGWYAQDANGQWSMVIPPHTPNADEEIKKSVDRQTAEMIRNEKQKNFDAGHGYQTDSDYATMISQANKDKISAATLAENIRQFDVTQGQKNKEFDITQAAADKRDAANIAKTGAETTQLGATTAQTQLTTDQMKAKFPVEMAQAAATLQGTNESNLTAAQTRVIAAAPQLKGTPGGANVLTTVDPRTGQVSQNQMDLAFQPKTQAEVAARVGQIQSLMNAKSQEVQGKVGQTINGKIYTADDALKDFNTWHTQQVDPQIQSLQAAQDEAAFQRGKDQAAMRSSALNAAQPVGAGAVSAFTAMANANPVGPGWEAANAAASKGDFNALSKVTDATTWKGPNPVDLYQSGVAQALKYVDPTAAQQAGAPPPNLQGYTPQQIGDMLGSRQYQPTPPVAAPAAAAPAAALAPVVSKEDQQKAFFDQLFARQQADAALQQRQAQVQGLPGQYDMSMQNRVAQPAGQPATGPVGTMPSAAQMPDWLTGNAPPPPPAAPGTAGAYQPWLTQYQYGG